MAETADLGPALISYLGYQRASYPQSDWRAVVDALGMERADAVELPMLDLLARLREMKPDWQALSLYQGSEWAVRELRRASPELDDRASKPLVWLFSYENK
ncbi:hypothetical protein P1X14_05830 [Sphingomonas sp. AOB5]|uniref:hypothetical protein n=1 Tax=Sphingomonas sp. AOB5 TaxID=3034017 RepID=UPI0023F951F2|nr:hypothetical protein [Sphingomonas sp. AOB5]MDF7774754.1 hypothetical protein [Sphingomonas sp. AOB5]